jgi:neutral ceramidase
VRTRAMTRRDLLAAATMFELPAAGGTWKAGVASTDITPDGPLWMAGFAARTQAAQGTALPLKAKALALQAGTGQPAVLVTADLLGLTARVTDAVSADVGRRSGLPRSRLLFNASHTHCGPVVDEQLSVAYDLTAEQWEAIRIYTARLTRQLTALIGDALSDLRPVTIGFASGEAGFAKNRRVQFSADGPVDRTVPVLRISTRDGGLYAIVFGYACHNTTLQAGFVQYHGDYAGIAQVELERRHPGTTALFVAGCGADANPSPRGTVELVKAHGRALAEAVDQSLPAATPFEPGLRAAYGTVTLPFEAAAVRARWRAGLDIEDVYLRRYDALMNSIVARGGRLPAAQAAPVQIWRFGGSGDARDLTLIAIGGEVVVDYAFRLAREFPGRRLWVAGYSNDVFGYLPSRRVREEGGYEGGDAMIYYGRPGPFTADVEERIVREVRRLAR